MVAGQRARADDMPDDVLGEELFPQGAQVAASKGRASRSHQVLVWLRHRTSSGSSAALIVRARRQDVKAAKRRPPDPGARPAAVEAERILRGSDRTQDAAGSRRPPKTWRQLRRRHAHAREAGAVGEAARRLVCVTGVGSVALLFVT